MTIEYPSPEMIHAGEVTPGHRGKAVERTKAAKTLCRSNKAAGQEAPSRFMRKIVCRLRLNEVSRQ